MPGPKFRQLYQEMVAANQELFTQFQVINDGYKSDRKRWSQKFHEVGAQVLEIIRAYEHRLCASMERGNYAQYSAKVAEKFWLEIKKDLSHIEMVGVKSNLD